VGRVRRRDTSAYTIPEIIISPAAKGDAHTNNILYTHSSDLLTMQEIFNVRPFLLDACTATDLSDLFKPGSMPNDVVPEPRSILQVTAGLFGLALMPPPRSCQVDRRSAAAHPTAREI
jgi:phosphatidylinositol-3-phosphatase